MESLGQNQSDKKKMQNRAAAKRYRDRYGVSYPTELRGVKKPRKPRISGEPWHCPNATRRPISELCEEICQPRLRAKHREIKQRRREWERDQIDLGTQPRQKKLKSIKYEKATTENQHENNAPPQAD